MSITNPPDKTSDGDPIDHEAAAIDARSDEAAYLIAELVEHAEELGRDVGHSPIPPAGDAPTRATVDDPAVNRQIDSD